MKCMSENDLQIHRDTYTLYHIRLSTDKVSVCSFQVSEYIFLLLILSYYYYLRLFRKKKNRHMVMI